MSDPATAVSWLFVPGDRPERFAKAAASGAHAVICDLEDAVTAEHKATARAAVADWVREHRAYVRVNAADSPWYAEDLAALAGAPGLAGVLVPKSESPEALAALVETLGDAAVLALVETALGVHEASTLARVPGVRRLAFGSLDFALDVDAEPGWEELAYARSRLVIASRVAGLAAPIDGVTTALEDLQRCAAEAAAARRFGFGGKLAIHPNQIEPINTAFTPSGADLEWAREVLAAVAEAGEGAARVRGQMIDRPRVLRARRLLDAARATGAER